MQIAEKEKVKTERYLRKKYFILPFICDYCVNKYAFEKGSKAVSDFNFSINSVYRGAKFCGNCTDEIMKYLKYKD